MSSPKTFRIKRFPAKKQKLNRPIPQWIRTKTGNKIRYNSMRRCWRRTRLGLEGVTYHAMTHLTGTHIYLSCVKIMCSILVTL
ncbi:large ribosomal subunit protein eL39-like [Mustela nigripes]|uniref:60S ribosomal protein L39-like n=2 Tax=Mustela TaxID=9665 RepID=A0A8U0V0K0_MUSPF|nr:60S ribosomal protein L39-like [Mustela putorius furo]XP_059009313.1 large ribosomal subunit protein eL39-like [Mustela lutreola]XP_059250395.1 large ribosomal subunit protein eL39-like [Mustela nigripes]